MKPVAIYWYSGLGLIIQPAHCFLFHLPILPSLLVKTSSLMGSILTTFLRAGRMRWQLIMFTQEVMSLELVTITIELKSLNLHFISVVQLILMYLTIILIELMSRWLLTILMSPAILLLVMIVARFR